MAMIGGSGVKNTLQQKTSSQAGAGETAESYNESAAVLAQGQYNANVAPVAQLEQAATLVTSGPVGFIAGITGQVAAGADANATTSGADPGLSVSEQGAEALAPGSPTSVITGPSPVVAQVPSMAPPASTIPPAPGSPVVGGFTLGQVALGAIVLVLLVVIAIEV